MNKMYLPQSAQSDAKKIMHREQNTQSTVKTLRNFVPFAVRGL